MGGLRGAEAAGRANEGEAAGGANEGKVTEGAHEAGDSGEAEAACRTVRFTPNATTDSSVTRSRTVDRRSGCGFGGGGAGGGQSPLMESPQSGRFVTGLFPV